MSTINVFFIGTTGQRIQATLPCNFSREDFRQVSVRSFGYSNHQLILNGRDIPMEDDARFNEVKRYITNGSVILYIQKPTGGCFLSDTLVLRTDGSQTPIDAIRPGDKLLAFTNSGEIVATVVQQTFVHIVDEYVELLVDHKLTTPLRVTYDHPFYIGKGQFLPLDRIEDEKNQLFVYRRDGKGKSVLTEKSIIGRNIVMASSTCVYNLSTAYPHTFFANGIAVHNKLGSLGVSFVDVSNTSGLSRIQWSDTAPRWRLAKPGICLEGECTNSSCVAYRQHLIINIGLRKFDLLIDANVTTAKCPCCSKYVEPNTCAFNRCIWRWCGIKQPASGQPPEEISANWRRADNAYHRFDEKISGTTVWRKLIIEAKEDN